MPPIMQRHDLLCANGLRIAGYALLCGFVNGLDRAVGADVAGDSERVWTASALGRKPVVARLKRIFVNIMVFFLFANSFSYRVKTFDWDVV